MNNQQRKRIQLLLNQLADIRAEIETIRDEEQGKYDNMPESFQQGEKGQRLEDIVSDLDNAVDESEAAEQSLQNAIQ